MLNDSNMISAVFSRFSGGLSGGSVCARAKRGAGVAKRSTTQDISASRSKEVFQSSLGTHQEHIMILGLGSQILENRLLPESFHVVPVLDLTMSDGVVKRVGSARHQAKT